MPDAKFVTTEANGLNVSYDPGQTYDTYRAFLSANPDVQFIENVDIGAEHADRTIGSLNEAGQVYTIGWNVSKGQLDGIENKGERFTDPRAATLSRFVFPSNWRRSSLLPTFPLRILHGRNQVAHSRSATQYRHGRR